MESHWKLTDGTVVDEAPTLEHGFVYVIVHTPTMRWYIGQKSLWKDKYLPPLKGRKRRRKKRYETDWREYWGSSDDLLADVEKYGKEQFERRIMQFCSSKAQLNYWETYEILRNGALLNPDSYNKYVRARINSNQLGVDK